MNVCVDEQLMTGLKLTDLIVGNPASTNNVSMLIGVETFQLT